MHRKISPYSYQHFTATDHPSTQELTKATAPSKRLYESYFDLKGSIQDTQKKSSKDKLNKSVHFDKICKSHSRASSDFSSKALLHDISSVAWNTKMFLNKSELNEKSEKSIDRPEKEMNARMQQLETRLLKIETRVLKNQQFLEGPGYSTMKLRDVIDYLIKSHNSEKEDKKFLQLHQKFIKFKKEMITELNQIQTNHKNHYIVPKATHQDTLTFQKFISLKQDLTDIINRNIAQIQQDLQAHFLQSTPPQEIFKSNRKFGGTPVSIVYEEYLRLNQSSKSHSSSNRKYQVGSSQAYKDKENEESRISSCVYYVDDEGYLLDCDMSYLVDRRGQQIRISGREMKILKEMNLLQVKGRNHGKNLR